MPHLQSYNEKELLSMLEAGDQKAMQTIFNEFFTRGKYYAVKLTGHDSEAEDIVMSALQKIWERRGQFKSMDHLGRSLFVMIHNACINYRDHVRVVENHQDYMLAAGAVPDEPKEYILMQAELLKYLREEIEALPPRPKDVIRLQLLYGLKSAEIARQLQMDESTVRSHRSRAVALLRTALLKRKLYGLGFVFAAMLKDF